MSIGRAHWKGILNSLSEIRIEKVGTTLQNLCSKTERSQNVPKFQDDQWGGIIIYTFFGSILSRTAAIQN